MSDAFGIFTHSDEDRKYQLADAYLRKSGGQYTVLFLGKNGEPQVDKSIECSFKHRVLSHVSSTLITDSTGAIYLGDLEDVLKLTVSCKEVNVKVNWDLKI
jgi:hypothetical protein